MWGVLRKVYHPHRVVYCVWFAVRTHPHAQPREPKECLVVNKIREYFPATPVSPHHQTERVCIPRGTVRRRLQPSKLS